MLTPGWKSLTVMTLTLSATLCALLSVTLPGWLYIGGVWYGLWEECDGNQCSKLKFVGFLQVVRVLMLLGTILLFLCCGGVVSHDFLLTAYGRLQNMLIISAMSTLAGCFVMMGVVCYVVLYAEGFHYCFGLAIVSSILSLVLCSVTFSEVIKNTHWKLSSAKTSKPIESKSPSYTMSARWQQENIIEMPTRWQHNDSENLQEVGLDNEAFNVDKEEHEITTQVTEIHMDHIELAKDDPIVDTMLETGITHSEPQASTSTRHAEGASGLRDARQCVHCRGEMSHYASKKGCPSKIKSSKKKHKDIKQSAEVKDPESCGLSNNCRYNDCNNVSRLSDKRTICNFSNDHSQTIIKNSSQSTVAMGDKYYPCTKSSIMQVTADHDENQDRYMLTTRL